MTPVTKERIGLSLLAVSAGGFFGGLISLLANREHGRRISKLEASVTRLTEWGVDADTQAAELDDRLTHLAHHVGDLDAQELHARNQLASGVWDGIDGPEGARTLARTARQEALMLHERVRALEAAVNRR